jgi:OOP family OmpA-OmpF porin
MKFQSLKVWLPLLLAVALSGCAGKTAPSLTFTPEGFPSGQYTAKSDNVQFILDASLTMGENGQQNFITAKNFLGAVNWSLPGDFGASTGLRSFGHSEQQSKNETDLVYGMAKYARDGFKAGLDKVKYTGGNSPLGVAISAAGADLATAAGTSRLVIVSDGTQHNMDDAAGAAAALKAKMGDKLCIYTVWVGDDLAGQKVLEKVAKAGGCGTADNAATLTDQKALAAYVERVFLNKKPAAAPAPVAAPAPPAPAPAATPCNGVVTVNLVFDFDKATIKDDMIPALEQATKIMNECPAATYVVAGHTCNIGTDAYNQGLSERRAAAVKSWLESHGVAASRLQTKGYGEAQPKYDNKTEEGRKLNRRVEFVTK